jgi:hypothetical protein
MKKFVVCLFFSFVPFIAAVPTAQAATCVTVGLEPDAVVVCTI